MNDKQAREQATEHQGDEMHSVDMNDAEHVAFRDHVGAACREFEARQKAKPRRRWIRR